ncbi:MAG TPA: hypothetical protein CFH84_02615 [Sulfurimonas sp. UBA12504]|nr:MAG: hypothetical protein A2019_07475 [Sulfurimonas sp. GWF2_37_8]DAB30719.1 MAG TPA: hypothetical protein CFH84_02615 [Sulfurimonas sp. UBA12504]
MAKIDNEQIEDLYKKFRIFYQSNNIDFVTIQQSKIVDNIVQVISKEKKFFWNETSLKGYIVNLIYMFKGEGFKWTINSFAENYFIENICKDFGPEICDKAKFALEEHKKYYKNITSRDNEILKENEINKENKNLLNIKNIILYGAPGVGKTHNYKKLVALIEGGDFLENKIFDFIINNKDDEIEEGSVDRLFKQIKDEERLEFITFHQSYSYEDFIEGFRPNESGNIKLEAGIFKRLCDEAFKQKEQNFYIVIDEINRGNISKIFGELITLIEEDKRDIYEVTLPYSKEKFKVPSNLYIIATMNSTDKSIATIDIALRRRFTFLKMKPNVALINFPDAKELFNKLNDFISDEDKGNLGKDYQLGHSYFMNIASYEDLEFVKEYKIKPLLEEYFYVDKAKLTEALNILNIENSHDI